MSLPNCAIPVEPLPVCPPEHESLPSYRAEALHGVPDLLTLADVARILRCSKAHVCNLLNGRTLAACPLPYGCRPT